MNELELIQEAGELVKSSLELMQDPVVSTAAGGFLGWLKGKFTSKAAKERIELIEKQEATEKTLTKLEADLEHLFEENETVQDEFRAKLDALKEAVEKVDKKLIRQKNVVNGNITNVKGNINIGDNQVYN